MALSVVVKHVYLNFFLVDAIYCCFVTCHVYVGAEQNEAQWIVVEAACVNQAEQCETRTED